MTTTATDKKAPRYHWTDVLGLVLHRCPRGEALALIEDAYNLAMGDLLRERPDDADGVIEIEQARAYAREEYGVRDGYSPYDDGSDA